MYPTGVITKNPAHRARILAPAVPGWDRKSYLQTTWVGPDVCRSQVAHLHRSIDQRIPVVGRFHHQAFAVVVKGTSVDRLFDEMPSLLLAEAVESGGRALQPIQLAAQQLDVQPQVIQLIRIGHRHIGQSRLGLDPVDTVMQLVERLRGQVGGLDL